MAVPRFRLIDDAEWQARAQPRAVAAGDSPVHSPARSLQTQLWHRAAASGTDHEGGRFPGLVRLAIPVGASILLWGAILKVAGLF